MTIICVIPRWASGSWILDPAYWVQDPGSCFLGPGAIQDPVSWILLPGPWIMDPGSILDMTMAVTMASMAVTMASGGVYTQGKGRRGP